MLLQLNHLRNRSYFTTLMETISYFAVGIMASPPPADASGSGESNQSSAVSMPTHAPESTDVAEIKSFLKKGETILETFTASVRGFDAQSAQIKRLEKAILEVAKATSTTSLKRKGANIDEEHSSAKRSRESYQLSSDSESDSELDPFESLDRTLIKKDGPRVDEDDIVAEMDSFFATKEQLGPKISDSVAQSIDGALKRAIPKEKMEQVLERNMRPENVTRLQVPKVDHFLWDKLQNTTKTLDAQRQKSIMMANQVMVPLIRAMDHMKTSSQPEIPLLRECITDAFIILANQITGTNQKRREIIRQEIRPNLRVVSDLEKTWPQEQELTQKVCIGRYEYKILNTVENFQAGKTGHNLNEWRKLTHDRWILQTISGYSVELQTKPFQSQYPQMLKFKDLEKTENH